MATWSAATASPKGQDAGVERERHSCAARTAARAAQTEGPPAWSVCHRPDRPQRGYSSRAGARPPEVSCRGVGVGGQGCGPARQERPRQAQVVAWRSERHTRTDLGGVMRERVMRERVVREQKVVWAWRSGRMMWAPGAAPCPWETPRPPTCRRPDGTSFPTESDHSLSSLCTSQGEASS
jgi:hypothetical protein